jgi:hypothetical protein
MNIDSGPVKRLWAVKKAVGSLYKDVTDTGGSTVDPVLY